MKIIPGAARHHWNNEWLDSWQSFPATGNFDLQANAHGVLLVHNDDTVDAGEGLDTHQHRNAEILTWVLDGVLAHRDSRGNTGVLSPGVVQRMTAGRGITHSEGNAAGRADGTPLRVIQMWVAPDTDDLEPGYAERDFTAELDAGEPVIVASGMRRHADTSAISLANRFAALHMATPHAGQEITLPTAPFGHLYVARGRVDVVVDGETATLEAGDAARLTDDGALRVRAIEDAELIYWEMHASFDL